VIACIALAACGGGGGDVSEPVPPQASFTGLGFLPGYTGSEAVAVSSDGRVVAGTAGTSARPSQAFRWTAQAGMVGLGFMAGGTYSAATGISADGSVVLANGDSASTPTTPPRGLFRWSAALGVVRLEAPSPASLCSGTGISGDGTVVVGTCFPGTSRNMAYRWTGSAPPVGLGQYGGGSSAESIAAAVSKDGSTIVGTGHPVLAGAIVWGASGPATILGKLPGDREGHGTAVARDGGTVVGYSVDSNQVSRGFRWTPARGMESLGPAPGGVIGTYPAGVSGDAQRVVGWGTTAAEDTALIWDSGHGWRTLAAALLADYRTDVPGWTLKRATAISDDGLTIVGYGTNPGGQTEGWLVRLPN